MKESARRPLPGSLSERKQTLREKELARKSPQLIQRPPVEKKGPLAGRLQGGRNEKQFAKFERLTPKHRLISRLPEQADAKKIHRIEDAKQLEDACHDAAQYTGTIKELIELRNIGDTEDGTGLHHMVFELVDNSIDEALAGFWITAVFGAKRGAVAVARDNCLEIDFTNPLKLFCGRLVAVEGPVAEIPIFLLGAVGIRLTGAVDQKALADPIFALVIDGAGVAVVAGGAVVCRLEEA